MKKISNFLKFIDIYGEKIELNINNKNKSPSIVGGILTVVTIGFVLGCAWTIGRDIFYHEVPIITLEDQLFTHRPKLILDSQSLPMAMTLQDYNQKSWDIPNFFKFEIFESIVYNNNFTTAYFFHNFSNCKYENFPNYSKDYFDKSGLANYLCVKNQNFTIEGYWDDVLLRQLFIRIRLCDNQTDGGGCSAISEIESFIDKQPIAWNIYFQNSIINIQNPNPISSYTLNIYKNVRLSVYRQYSIFIKPQTIYTDTGFIFENFQKDFCLSYDSSYIDESDFKHNLPLVDIIINVGEHQNIYKRSYIKVQNIIANLGGLLKAAMVVSYISSFYFSKIKIYQKIANSILEFGNKEFKNYQKPKPNSSIGIMKVSAINPLFRAGLNENVGFNYGSSQRPNQAGLINLVSSTHPKKENRNKISNINLTTNNNIQGNLFMKSDDDNKICQSENNPDGHTRNKIKFTTYDVIKYICCYFRINTESEINWKFKIYRNTQKFIFEKLDVRNIIQNVEEFERLKKIMFDEIQFHMFKLVSKKPINELEIQKSIRENIENFSENEQLILVKHKILSIKNNGKDISEIDRRLYSQMTEGLKRYIEQS
jgi:hypothetical protein